MYKVQVTPLIGLPRFDGWAHVTTSSAGKAIWALSVFGQHARNIGRDLLDTINAAGTISNGAELYRLVESIIQEAIDKEGDISLACGWLADHGKSVFCVYQGSVILKRSGKSGPLLQSGLELRVIEGKASTEDIYIFATQQSTQFVGEIQQKLEQGYDIDTIVTSIVPSLHLQEATALSAMAFVKQLPRLAQDPDVDSDMSSVATVESVSPDAAVPNIPSPVISPELSPDLMLSATEPEVSAPPVMPLAISSFDSTSNISSLPNTASSTVSTAPTVSGANNPLQRRIAQGQDAFKKIISFVSSAAPNWRTALTTKILKGDFSAPLPMAGSDVYVGQSSSRRNLRFILLGLLATAVIAAGGGYFWYGRHQQQVEAATALQPLQEKIQTVRSTVEQDPIAARANLQQVIEDLKPWEVAFKEKPVALRQLQAVTNEAQMLYDEISGREEFSELPVFFNGRNDQLDIVITESSVLEESAVFYDAQKKQGAVVTFADATVTPFTTEIEATVSDVAARASDNTMWLLSNAIHQAKPTQSNIDLTERVASADRLSSSTLLSVFGESLYIFNPTERTIFKYTETDDTFGEPTRWLRSVPGLDFEQIASMVVDGDIWLTSQTGEIFRLRSGNRQDFTINGLAQPFDDTIYLFTTEASDKLYLLEPKRSRVVVLTKDGEFLREVTSSSLAAASQIIVNPAETALLAISGSTVYRVDL